MFATLAISYASQLPSTSSPTENAQSSLAFCAIADGLFTVQPASILPFRVPFSEELQI